MPDFDPFADDDSESSSPAGRRQRSLQKRWLPSVNGSADVDLDPKDPDASRRAQWCCLHCRADVWTLDAE